ncbi:HNH endonuclease signature motif containing protein [Rhodococcus ruber]|uniref:HNH endonuclease signature motif containing protein n=1 Tax=Rhodococcus ruber TaxID=1830 RepID=UPI003784BA41
METLHDASPTIRERFEAKYVVDDETGCWNWMGATNGTYGTMLVGNRRVTYAHRISYVMHVAPIPDEMTIDHLCKNVLCVNYAHMEVVTRGENTLRGTSPAALNKGRTHCRRGHEFTPQNTYVVPKTGKRNCLKCKYVAIYAYEARQREKRRAERK